MTSFDAIAADFALLDDWEDKYRTLIELGRTLPDMDPALKTASTKVPGCSSSVWLHASVRPGPRLHFDADSDAHIVRGLAALLLTLFQDKTPADVLATDARAQLNALGLGAALSATRTNGLYAMVGRIQALAREQAA